MLQQPYIRLWLSPSHSDILSIGSHNRVSINNVNDNVKVPKLIIHRFYGDVLYWLSGVSLKQPFIPIQNWIILINLTFSILLKRQTSRHDSRFGIIFWKLRLSCWHFTWEIRKQTDINFFSNGRFSKISNVGIHEWHS